MFCDQQSVTKIHWYELMRISLSLGISPNDFWHMTYPEFTALLSDQDMLGGVSRQEFEQALANAKLYDVGSDT